MTAANATEDGSCDPAAVTDPPCTWATDSSEGGFHYSMWTLSKGAGSYLAPDLSSGTNWYTKIADLLVRSQCPATANALAADKCTNGGVPDGAWPYPALR